MDETLQQIVVAEAQRSGLSASGPFFAKLDDYVGEHFPSHSADQKRVIQTYLAHGAIHIARTEGKSDLGADDAKAAIWLFHLPDQPDDTCAAAGERALTEEARRPMGDRGFLSENLRAFLDQ